MIYRIKIEKNGKFVGYLRDTTDTKTILTSKRNEAVGMGWGQAALAHKMAAIGSALSEFDGHDVVVVRSAS